MCHGNKDLTAGFIRIINNYAYSGRVAEGINFQ